MPRIIRKLLKGRQLIAVESIIAEDKDGMQWLSTLYSDPHVRILKEDTRNLATHVLFIIKYSYPEDYHDTLIMMKNNTFKHDDDDATIRDRDDVSLAELLGEGEPKKVRKEENAHGIFIRHDRTDSQ